MHFWFYLAFFFLFLGIIFNHVQGGENAKHEVPPVNDVLPSTQQMPEKSILELVLNTLKRIVTHTTFVELVDPNKVKGYYEFIKNPMDFGTMRAKLHEGMYTTLKLFEMMYF